jgi:hypothetical protein
MFKLGTLMMLSQLKVSRFHILRVLSRLPESKYFPLGSQKSWTTMSECPERIFILDFFWTSQILITWSVDEEIAVRLSREMIEVKTWCFLMYYRVRGSLRELYASFSCYLGVYDVADDHLGVITSGQKVFVVRGELSTSN